MREREERKAEVVRRVEQQQQQQAKITASGVGTCLQLPDYGTSSRLSTNSENYFPTQNPTQQQN